MTITYDEFIRIRNVVLVHLRQLKLRDSAFEGLSLRELVHWFIAEHSSAQSEAELVSEHKKVKAVIVRLLEKEHILVTEDYDREQDERRLLPHPNYDITQQ